MIGTESKLQYLLDFMNKCSEDKGLINQLAVIISDREVEHRD